MSFRATMPIRRWSIILFFAICPAIARSETPAPNADGQAKIEFEALTKSFGTVPQGHPAKVAFKFKSSGKADLVIQSMKSSCGCTAAAASTGPYRPGETGQIDVDYDTRGKFGHTQKQVQIFTNDPASPHTLTIEGTVAENSAHPPMAAGDVLFKGNCAECHAKPAKGKKGKELYDAVCFMCHDLPQQQGKNAIAADRSSLAQLSRSDLKRIITHGMQRTSMPGFSKGKGGPLDKKQIDSLVDYLMELRKGSQ